MITKLLLEHGANPNVAIKYSLQTPLHLAARVNSNGELIKILLAYKALVSSLDKYDKKPIDYAESNEAKAILSETESNQLIQISETTNTYHENTLFTLENRLDSFMTKEDELSKDQCISSAGKHTDRPVRYNNNGKFSKIDIPQEYLNTVLSPSKSNEKIQASSNISCSSNDEEMVNNWSIKDKADLKVNENENNKFLNDSLDNNMSYSRSKEEYISDFPFSSSKKPEESNDIIYKKVIQNKRLTLSNNKKISYHKKIISDKAQADEYNYNYNQENINPNTTNTSYNLNQRNTTLLETCIHNCTEQFLTSNGLNLNNTAENVNHFNLNSNSNRNVKRIYTSNNHDSTFSTQPKSNIINSFKSKKGDSRNLDNESFAKVSEFSIKSMLNKNIPSIHLSKIKKWLKQIRLSIYLPSFIDNEAYDYDKLMNHLHNCNITSQYDFFENIVGIKKPGHIYRLLTQFALDNLRIEDNVIKFILPKDNHIRTNSQTGESNLKISGVYCCGCNLFNKQNRLDLNYFLNKKGLIHLYSNFTHNGFDLFEYVLLQMYTEYTLTDEILENSLHIYNELDRKMLTKSLIEEINKINVFINSKEYNDNMERFKYETLNLETEAKDKQCISCLIY